jgi:hypothetical protein
LAFLVLPGASSGLKGHNDYNRKENKMVFRVKIQPMASAAAAVFAGVVLISTSVQAADVLGEIWQNVPASGADASLVPAGAPDAMFHTPAIDYNSDVTGYTAAQFLNNPVFFNTSGSFDPNASFDDTFIRFTGQTFLHAGVNSFVVPHDDGLTLTMGGGIGLVLSEPGPTGPVFTPFDVTAPADGLYDFVLQYGECCGPPAVLGFEINGAPVGGVPDGGSSLALLGLAAGGLLAWRKR